MNSILNLFLSLIQVSNPTSFESEAAVLAIKQVSLGEDMGCAILENDKVKCWGKNTYGQLGYGNTGNYGNNADTIGDKLPYISFDTSAKPIQILSNFDSACVLFDIGQIKCWGINADGKLGYGDTANRGDKASTIPAKLPFVNLGKDLKVKKLSGRGGDFFCALFTTGQVKCWGTNRSGQLGLGSTAFYGNNSNTIGDKLPFLKLGTDRTAIDISAGGAHTCVLLDNHKVKCWGDSARGKTGSGAEDNLGDSPNETPDLLPALDLGVADATPIRISASRSHTCVFFDNDRAKCFGDNGEGALGLGHTTNMGVGKTMGENLPYVDFGDLPMVDIQAFEQVTCVLLINSGIKCVGLNNLGGLGYGDTVARGGTAQTFGESLGYVNLGVAERVVQVSAEQNATCFVTMKGIMKCVGTNESGQLAYGDIKQRGNTPETTPDVLAPVNLGMK